MKTINWHALLEDELHYLDQLPVRREESTIAFTSDLSWDEITQVFGFLHSIYRRTPNREENDICWALGDCQNEIERLFGAAKLEVFVKDHLELIALRDKVLEMTGGCLIQTQMVEHIIRLCCAIFKIKGMDFNVSDFISGDKKLRKATLGKMKDALRDTEIFSSNFEDDFHSYVQNRNEFVHHLWAKEATQHSPGTLPDKESINRIGSFTCHLMEQSMRIDRVFRGMLAYTFSQLPAEIRNDISSQHDLWSHLKLIPEFEAVRRKIQT